LELLDGYFEPRALRARLGWPGSSVPLGTWQRALQSPLSEFLGRPSKELRARLVQHAYAVAGGRGECSALLGSIVEIVHAASLIVDDIEDQSQSRRGRPTLHRLHGLALALNSANWLYFWAFELIQSAGFAPSIELELLRRVNSALLLGHHGQALDIAVSVADLDAHEVEPVVNAATRLKTGALFGLAGSLGAIAAGANAEVVAALHDFGVALGVGLQMLDDYSGLTNRERQHKGDEDLVLGRPTWAWAWAAGAVSKPEYEALRHSLRKVVEKEQHPEWLAHRIRSIIAGIGRARTHEVLAESFGSLRARVGESEQLELLAKDVEHLERVYG
jgi:geranylgeranyl pyrophosphate synthase